MQTSLYRKPVERGELQSLLKLRVDKDRQSSDCNNFDERRKRVRLNVSGTIFETYKKTLTQKEGSIFKLENIRNYYDSSKEEYYFDRNPKAFEAIFAFMQCGILCQPAKVPYKIFIEELQFFGFGKRALKIFEEGHGKVSETTEYIGRNKILATIWDLLEHPDSSTSARVVTSFSMFVIILAVCLFSINTQPEFRRTTRANVIKQIERFCFTWFTIEIVMRFISCPMKLRFFTNAMNIIDIISLIPYYVEMSLQSSSYSKVVVSALRTLRIARIFNLLKLYRYSRAIRVMAKTLYSSVAELSMLLFFVSIGTMLFSPLLYYFELNNDPDNEFKSIPHVFWFCIVTTTTVGFGDIVPATPGGKLAACMLTVCSIILVTLPIPIIGRNFLIFYEAFFGNESTGGMYTFDMEKSKEVESEELIEHEAVRCEAVR